MLAIAQHGHGWAPWAEIHSSNCGSRSKRSRATPSSSMEPADWAVSLNTIFISQAAVETVELRGVRCRLVVDPAETARSGYPKRRAAFCIIFLARPRFSFDDRMSYCEHLPINVLILTLCPMARFPAA